MFGTLDIELILAYLKQKEILSNHKKKEWEETVVQASDYSTDEVKYKVDQNIPEIIEEEQVWEFLEQLQKIEGGIGKVIMMHNVGPGYILFEVWDLDSGKY